MKIEREVNPEDYRILRPKWKVEMNNQVPNTEPAESEWSDALICIHCDQPESLHMGKNKYCAGEGTTTYENNANVRVVRHVDRPLLGQEKPQFVSLPITDDRNENPDYAAWRGI